VPGIICRQLTIPQPRSTLIPIAWVLISLVAGILHCRITIIVTVCLLATALVLWTLADIMLPGLIWRLVRRWLTPADRVVTPPGLVVLAVMALFGIALADIALPSMALADIGLADIALAHNLFSGNSRIICQQLFVFTRVDTLFSALADMR
jgi:hypothetical protein